MHTEVMREKVFNIRLSAEEWARVEAVAAHHGLNASGLFRFLLKKEEREIGIPAAPASSPAKKSAKKSSR